MHGGRFPACAAAGGNLTTDAFGVVAMVAITPLITIQILGLVTILKQRKRTAGDFLRPDADEDAIIEL